MNGRPTLADLEAFATIAERRSFRRAADDLGLSPSTLSHMMRALEGRMGVRLLHRTTRSVSPTEAGTALLNRLSRIAWGDPRNPASLPCGSGQGFVGEPTEPCLGPVLRALDHALDVVGDHGGQPAGTLRINADEAAARVLLRSVVPTFHERFPSVSLDLVTDGRFIDIVTEGFDAGVRLGEAVPKDMVAVRFGGDARFVAVASPAYLACRGMPRTPDDLAAHACIRVRLPSGRPYRWEFACHGREIAVDVPGLLTLDHPGLMAEAAADGLGIAYLAERWVAPLVATGALVLVLDGWCPPIPGLFLYYPGHRHVPSALRAFIDVLKLVHYG